ncbi:MULTISPECIES: hypothetical protein [unclassified Acidocella]|uniref:hypothetical protein n=1 Tax=unclassified Acidocella TaxID=2648610 RepID=UPI001181A954|nr:MULTISPECIES: hypothetical protein [unclassified Acidocella]WBO59439.1 hypothetical protein GT370_00340 [Acidocella sp. MX-AZ03]
MFPIKNQTTAWLAAAAFALLPAMAHSATPDKQAVSLALGLSGHQIGPKELGCIRGGFDLNKLLSISFAFKQVETIDGVVVKSIMVPETDVTAATSSTNGHANTATATASTPVSVSTPSLTVTDANGNTQTITPTVGNTVNLTTTGNSGRTIINTQLGSGGLSNQTTNTANNTSISVAATMNIAISGLSRFLTQQQSFANTQAGLYYAGNAFK